MLRWFSKKKYEGSRQQRGREGEVDQFGLKAKKRSGLPRNFAKKVIDLELQCERPDTTRVHVNDLMDLYTVSSNKSLKLSYLVSN